MAVAIEIWGVLRRPSSVFGLGALVLAGFAAGIVFWGGFNTVLELANTEPFCVSCHEMRDNVFDMRAEVGRIAAHVASLAKARQGQGRRAVAALAQYRDHVLPRP